MRRLYWVLRPSKNRRMFAYDRRLLVNEYLAEQESATADLESAIARTGFSLGYPSWNLLYYTLLCSLPRSGSPVVTNVQSRPVRRTEAGGVPGPVTTPSAPEGPACPPDHPPSLDCA